MIETVVGSPQFCWVVARDGSPEGDARYVRGDQIVQVWREGLDPDDSEGLTRVIASLPDGHRVTLWTLQRHILAAHAALRLVEILIAGKPGLVVLANDEDGDEGDPYVEWHAPSRGAGNPV